MSIVFVRFFLCQVLRVGDVELACDGDDFSPGHLREVTSALAQRFLHFVKEAVLALREPDEVGEAVVGSDAVEVVTLILFAVLIDRLWFVPSAVHRMRGKDTNVFTPCLPELEIIRCTMTVLCVSILTIACIGWMQGAVRSDLYTNDPVVPVVDIEGDACLRVGVLSVEGHEPHFDSVE